MAAPGKFLRALVHPPTWMRRRIVAEHYIPALDGLRFVALIAVVIEHIAIQTHPVNWDDYAFATQRRWLEVFFVISGFILAVPFARHRLVKGRPVSLSFYFLRRITRLEPPYMVIMLLRFCLFLAIEHKPVWQYTKYLLASMTYTHNVIYGVPSFINRPAWSLEVEVQFYCLVPLLAFVYSIRSAKLRRSIWVAAIVLAGIAQGPYDAPHTRAELSILYYIQFFLVGFLVADIYLTVWQNIREHWGWDVVLLLWIPYLWVRTYWWHGAMSLLLIPLFIAAFKGPLQKRFFSIGWVSTIGGMCYSVYLTHALMLSTAVQISHHIPGIKQWGVWLLCLLMAYGFGMIFFVLIERPCMNPHWPKELWKRFFPDAAATSDAAV